MIWPRPLTNGELTAWRRCHRKWWLSWHRGLKRRPVATDEYGPRETGTVVHTALQLLYSGADMQAIGSAVEGDELAACMVEGYLEWLEVEGPDEGLEVETVEVVARGQYNGLELAGKVDLKGRDREGRWLVMDHKTVGSINQHTKLAGMYTQPKHYLLIERLGGAPVVEYAGAFMYNLLRRVKRTVRARPPFYDRLPVYVTDQVLDTYLRGIWRQVQEMSRVEQLLDDRDVDRTPSLVPPTPTRDCSWDCDFFAVCPMFDENRADAETVIALAYVEGDPLEHHREDYTGD